MTYLGNHTMSVQRGINLGVALFIVSEALFFLAIFWAFFHEVYFWEICDERSVKLNNAILIIIGHCLMDSCFYNIFMRIVVDTVKFYLVLHL